MGNIKAKSAPPKDDWSKLFDQREKGFEFVNHPPELFNLLVADELDHVRSYVVSNRFAPESALNIVVNLVVSSELARISTHALRKLLAHEKFTPSMGERLMTKEFTHRTLAASFSDKMPDGLFEQLNESDDIYIHLALVNNSDVPLSVLVSHRKFLEDGNKYPMARAFLNNPKTPPEILVRIHEFRNKYLGDELLIHPATPKEIIVELWKEAVSKRKYKTIGYILRNQKKAPPVLFSKALIFNNHKTPPNKRVSHLRVEPPTQEEYFRILKTFYPEVTEDFPLEWLKGLADSLQLRHFRVTVEELEK